MPAKAKPFEQFGPFILFKKFEADSLSDLWRAARIEGTALGQFVALRRFTGGHRTAMLEAAAQARDLVPLLTGTSFVKRQLIDIQDTIPYVAHEYAGGRSLRYIVDRARGSTGAQPNPIPIDQAVLVADRVALSLATTGDLRQGGTRLAHGGLLPHFVWITDDGEVRVAGQNLGKGLIASLGDTRVNSEIGRYFSPEYHTSGQPTKSSEIYSMGAILFLLVTGHEPPDPLSVSAFAASVRAAKTMAGQPIPLEIRTILDKSLILDPASRYASMQDMKQAISAVAAKYSSTTFNLAFYLSTLLKKEMEAEEIDRDRESKTNLAPYLAPPPVPSVAAAVAAPPPAPHEPPPSKSRMPLIATAIVLVIALAGAYMLTQKTSAPATTATPAPAAQPAPVYSEPVVASTTLPAATATTASVDPQTAQKAFEDAVNRKMQEEMLKLQSNFNRELQQRKSQNAPVVAAPATARAEVPRPAEEQAPSAAALDERRLAARTEPAPQPAAPVVVQPQPQAQAQPQPQPQPQPALVEPAPIVRAVQEGDVVEMSDLDTAPRPLRAPNVVYPPMAVRQRVQTSVIVTALVSENGDVIDVKVLRGDNRFGFNEAALRAMRNAKFTSPVKSGKRVKTWYPQTVNFKL